MKTYCSRSLLKNARIFFGFFVLIQNPVIFAMNVGLRMELLSMRDIDQQVRQKAISANDHKVLAEIGCVAAEHTQKIKQIIADYGWPDEILVGVDGSKSAWLLVQHSSDLVFQKECLLLLKRAVDEEKASAQDYAYLYDRIAISENRPQMYGTQGTIVQDNFVLYPIDDEAHVEDRRKALGLDNLKDYISRCKAFYLKN